VGCIRIPSETVFSFRRLSCRRDEHKLLVSDADTERLVVCNAVRLFDEASLLAWLGEGAGGKKGDD